jgi:hypothetical protein
VPGLGSATVQTCRLPRDVCINYRTRAPFPMDFPGFGMFSVDISEQVRA